ncbi:DUF1189 family protein [[Clostridium] colinum]|uniref:DUF1189 family protein n=1 Tax=[Clostridium] colinum TaxID=36835 RepID=UPI002023F4F9|nr:DUF1189 family protein [[Clostridium] colinum]
MYIFKQAKNSILDFDKYPELLKTRLSKVIFYALFFIIFSNAIYSSSPFISYYLKTRGFDNFIEKYIPNFKVENNKIIFDKYSKVSTPLDITFIFDTKENNKITDEDKKDSKNMILKITPTNIISSTLNVNLPVAPLLETLNITKKSDLVNIKPLIKFANIFAFILVFTIFIILDIISLLFFMFLVKFIANFYKINLTMSNIFKLTVYVNTVPYLLKICLFILSMPLPFFIYVGIIIAYLHFIFKSILLDEKEKQLSVN